MSADTDLRFLRNFQRLLDEGQFVSTYKFALLQALADLAVERDADLDQGLRLPVTAIAEKFIEYYWRQALPFRPDRPHDQAILKQNTEGQAAIVNLVLAERSHTDVRLAVARADRHRWSELRREVAGVVRQMPLWKLQTVAGRPEEFLYKRAEYEKGCIRLLSGVPGALRSFHGLITHLVRGAWIARINRIGANRELLGDTGDLSEFLFGAERASLEEYRVILRKHQAGDCFYCGKQVNVTGDVDHFIAWSRYPVDLGHNFVFAHSSCNHDKQDYLAAAEHLARWRDQNVEGGDSLDKAFTDSGLPHDRHRSRHIAGWAYEQGETAGAHAWIRKKLFCRLGSDWRDLLGPARGMRLVAEESVPYD